MTLQFLLSTNYYKCEKTSQVSSKIPSEAVTVPFSTILGTVSILGHTEAHEPWLLHKIGGKQWHMPLCYIQNKYSASDGLWNEQEGEGGQGGWKCSATIPIRDVI